MKRMVIILVLVALCLGAAVQAELNADFAYPFAAETSIEIVSEGVREIVFDETEEGVLEEFFGGPFTCYIVNGDTVQFTASIGPELNPDNVVLTSSYDEIIWDAYEILNVTLETKVETRQTKGSNHTEVAFKDKTNRETYKLIVLCADEENANALEELMIKYGITTGYVYADGGERGTREIAPLGIWVVGIMDQDHKPVSGCIVNFCTDDTCIPVQSDENGLAAYIGAPYPYHLQVIQVPEGYEYDTTQEIIANEAGGAWIIYVTHVDGNE